MYLHFAVTTAGSRYIGWYCRLCSAKDDN